MTADEQRSAGRDFGIGLGIAVAVLIAVIATFLVTHYVVDKNTVATPNPETVTCGQWPNLTAAQQNKILESLGVESSDVDIQCESQKLLDTMEGTHDASDAPVSGATRHN